MESVGTPSPTPRRRVMKRTIKDGAESDAYSKWGRKYLCYLGRPGVVKKIKRFTHKRERREGRGWIKEQMED